MLRVVTFNYEVFFGATISETMEFMFIESFPPVIRDAVAMIDAVGTPEDCIWLPLVGTRDGLRPARDAIHIPERR